MDREEAFVKRNESRELTKHTINLYVGQLDKLQELHSRLGAAKVIRTLVDNHIAEAEVGAADSIPNPPAPSVPITELL